jgi:hypothetical protein
MKDCYVPLEVSVKGSFKRAELAFKCNLSGWMLMSYMATQGMCGINVVKQSIVIIATIVAHFAFNFNCIFRLLSGMIRLTSAFC